MARYRLLGPTFIGGSMRQAGEIVEYDGTPGSTLQAIDQNSKVDIPEDWRTQNGLQRMALARQLGAPKSRISAEQADAVIAAEVESRSQAKLAAEKPVEAEPHGEAAGKGA